jgi:hypothetical protein
MEGLFFNVGLLKGRLCDGGGGLIVDIYRLIRDSWRLLSGGTRAVS